MSQNVDPQEIAKFSELAHRWWDGSGDFAPLHAINPLRLDWIDRQSALAGKRVVDVGCGGGILSDSMARRGAEVLGIDLAGKALTVARLHALEAATPAIAYREIAVESLALEQPASFDVVTCMEMLEHVPDPASVVDACAHLVKPGGWVFFSTISRNAKAFLYAIVGAEHLLKLLPAGTHEYGRFLRPSELLHLGRSAGLDAEQVCGMEYNPISRRYRLSGDARVNYLLSMRRPQLS